ncbi:kinase-like domain, phloem protein 2-like protein, partial [Tanacetum coccineum]
VEHEQVLEDEKLSNDSLQWTMKGGVFSYLLKRFNGQKGYSVAKNGKKCLTLSARGVITSSKLYFKPSPESRFGSLDVHPKSGYSFAKTADVIDGVSINRHTPNHCIPVEMQRFREVAVIHHGRFFIEKKIESDALTPETTYACYLVYKYTGDLLVLEDHFTSNYIYLVSPPKTPIIGQKLDQNTHSPLNRPKLNAVPRQRSDGWMEVKVREFETLSSTRTINMYTVLRTPNLNYISGLIIESIELRPIVAQ